MAQTNFLLPINMLTLLVYVILTEPVHAASQTHTPDVQAPLSWQSRLVLQANPNPTRASKSTTMVEMKTVMLSRSPFFYR